MITKRQIRSFVVLLAVVASVAGLAARGASQSAFDRRCIPPRCVAQRSNIPDILAFRALRSGRIDGLGATTDFHHGLLDAAEVIDRVIAVVSGSVITLSDARAAILFGLVDVSDARDPVAVAMQWLVDRQLVLDEVNRYETPSPDLSNVEPVFSEIRKKLAGGKGLPAALASVGLEEDAAKRFVRDTLRVQQYVKARFESIMPGTEEELRQHYLNNRSRFTRDGRQLTFDEARELVQEHLQEGRRIQAIDVWLARLRRRADVNELYLPTR